MLRIREKGKCLPVTLEEARQHLSVDTSNRSNDAIILAYIDSASQNTEQVTGRIWVESVWEWDPKTVSVGKEIPFPVAPVTKVQIFNLDEDEQSDISGDVASITFPSPEPQGSPLMGSLLPLSGFPTNFKILLTIGYPVEEEVKVIEQYTPPVLVVESTRYSESKVSLVFDRPVEGVVTKDQFTITQNGEDIEVDSIEFVDGRVELSFLDGILEEGASIQLSFVEGEIFDQFDNFVEPIEGIELPVVAFVPEEDFVAPDPVPTESTFVSLVPSVVKTAILLKVGFLYTQRTGSALKTGKEIEKNFSDQVVESLLNPYRTRFF